MSRWGDKTAEQKAACNASATKYRRSDKGMATRRKNRHSEKGRELALDRRSRYLYDADRAEIFAIFELQGYQCAICGGTDPGGRWCADHDHKTDKLRSVLCHKCNAGLGLFEDTPALLRAAAAYLNL